MLALLTENEIAIIGLLGMCVAQITLPLRVFDSLIGAWKTGIAGTLHWHKTKNALNAFSTIIYIILLRKMVNNREKC